MCSSDLPRQRLRWTTAPPRSSSSPAGCGLQIPAMLALIGEGKGSVRFRERRRGWWCEELSEGRPPFYSEREGRRVTDTATIGMSLRAAKGQGEHGVSFRALRRSSGTVWRRRRCSASGCRRARPCRCSWRTVACAASSTRGGRVRCHLNGGVQGLSRVEGGVLASGASRRGSEVTRAAGVHGLRDVDPGAGHGMH